MSDYETFRKLWKITAMKNSSIWKTQAVGYQWVDMDIPDHHGTKVGDVVYGPPNDKECRENNIPFPIRKKTKTHS